MHARAVLRALPGPAPPHRLRPDPSARQQITSNTNHRINVVVLLSINRIVIISSSSSSSSSSSRKE